MVASEPPEHAASPRGRGKNAHVSGEATDLRKAQGERVRAARKMAGLTIDEAATSSGLHFNTLARIERGESEATIDQILTLGRLFGRQPAELSPFPPATSPNERDLVVEPSTSAVQQGNTIFVPHFDVHASAGTGDVFNHVEQVKAMRGFDQAYIRGELGIKHDDIALISVVGNSMEPKLQSGDTVLVDLGSAKEMFTDGIHLVRLDQSLLVKQVQRLPGKVYRIRSLNPHYEPFDIQATDEVERDFAIIGRVRWGGVNIK